MHSRASLAAKGINSVKPTSVDPKRRVMSSARKDPKSSAASSGTVITASPSTTGHFQISFSTLDGAVGALEDISILDQLCQAESAKWASESVCTAAILSRACLLCATSGHSVMFGACPLCPRKRTSFSTKGSRASARHEAANVCVAVAVVKGPHNGRAETVGLGHNGGVRHDDPLSIDSHTIVPVLGVPVDVLHSGAVGKRAAQASSARETVEPRLERRIRESAVVPCIQLVENECRQVKCQSCDIGESAHRGLPRWVPRV